MPSRSRRSSTGRSTTATESSTRTSACSVGEARPSVQLGERAFEIVLARKVARERATRLVRAAPLDPDHRDPAALAGGVPQPGGAAHRADRDPPPPEAAGAARVQAAVGRRALGVEAGACTAATGSSTASRTSRCGTREGVRSCSRWPSWPAAWPRTTRSSRSLELWAGRTVTDAGEGARPASCPTSTCPTSRRCATSQPGLRKREQWEETWALQRREDAGETVGRTGAAQVHARPTSSRRRTGATAASSTCPRSGSSPTPAPSGAPTTASSSAGRAGTTPSRPWRSRCSWTSGAGARAGRPSALTPLLAGLAELEPWVHQWHAERDARTGMSPAQAVTGTLDQQLTSLHLTREDLAAWRPPTPTRGRRRRST